MTVACDRADAERASEKAGQTVTTAADTALDAGKQELKREWNDLDVKVNVSTTARDAGTVERSPRPARP